MLFGAVLVVSVIAALLVWISGRSGNTTASAPAANTTPVSAANQIATAIPISTQAIDTTTNKPMAFDGTTVGVTNEGWPYIGSPNAKVTIVEFADYQCPYCGQFVKEVYPQLKSYLTSGKVRLIFRDFPFLGPESNMAAEAGNCALDQGVDKFWQYHDLLFNKQGEENKGSFSKDNLKKFAEQVGLDTKKFSSCLDNGDMSGKVKASLEIGRTAGVSGTPTFFVSGKKIPGFLPADKFLPAVDDALKGG
ncbi:MAG: DsbA family protein [Chloroflexi bacterium]|nr:DsbA family protein [Chloroflexota bacterium]